jgi:hypothetical protein
MTEVVLTHTIDAGTEITAAELQQNFVDLRDVVNGGLEGGVTADSNIKENGVTSREIEAGAVGASEIGTMPRVHLRHSTTQVINQGGTGSALTFDTEVYDTDTMHGANPTRITATQAGLYLIGGIVIFPAVAARLYVTTTVYIRLNGTTQIAHVHEGTQNANNEARTLGVVVPYALAATDYVELIARHTNSAGGNHTFAASTDGGNEFWAQRLAD